MNLPDLLRRKSPNRDAGDFGGSERADEALEQFRPDASMRRLGDRYGDNREWGAGKIESRIFRGALF